MRMLIKVLILPPGLQLVFLALGLALTARVSASSRTKWVGYLLLSSGFLSLLLMSLPVVVGPLLKELEIYPPVTEQHVNDYQGQAIVILSGGIVDFAPEWGRTVSGSQTVVRLRYGANLNRLYGLPILLSGGSVTGEGRAEAQVMAQDLKDSFEMDAEWLETESQNTWENAQFSAKLLEAQGIKRVVLVTSAWHMRRAVAAFEYFGLEVLPAPTGFLHPMQASFGARWLPSMGSLSGARLGLHECLGLLYYWYLKQSF